MEHPTPILRYDPTRCRIWVPGASPATPTGSTRRVLAGFAAAGVAVRLAALAGAVSRPRR